MPSSSSPAPQTKPAATSTHTQTHLQFLLHLSDPDHELVHTTIAQAVPGKWLDIWDKHDWVEDLVVEALRLGVEVIGQEYVVARMGWAKDDEQPVVDREADAVKEQIQNE